MKLLSKHEKAIKAVIQFIREGEFYLAGGTAVYYYLKHRKSLDLDFLLKRFLTFSNTKLTAKLSYGIFTKGLIYEA